MLKNAPFLITIGVDRAENEPRKESCVGDEGRGAERVRSATGSEYTHVTVRATTHHPFRGSFSAVSTPIVMRNGAFFSIFQNLQEFTLFS